MFYGDEMVPKIRFLTIFGVVVTLTFTPDCENLFEFCPLTGRIFALKSLYCLNRCVITQTLLMDRQIDGQTDLKT